MLITKRRPVSASEIVVEEFMIPLGLTQAALAAAMGVPRKHVNEICNDRRTFTASTALILARVFGNTADFWLNIPTADGLVEGHPHSPRERERIDRAKPIQQSAALLGELDERLDREAKAIREPAGVSLADFALAG